MAIGTDNTRSGADRNHRHHAYHYNQQHNGWFKGLVAVNLCLHFVLTAPAAAAEGGYWHKIQEARALGGFERAWLAEIGLSFDFGPNDKDFIGEDVFFCELLREYDHKIWLDPTIPAGHVGDWSY